MIGSLSSGPKSASSSTVQSGSVAPVGGCSISGPTTKGAPQTAKQWVILGFLCAHSFTYEGNTHKGLKRAAGTALGGLAVELALIATTDYVSILFFTFFSIAGAVFIFASPTHPASEFDREFGYIGQVFIWTVTFILDVIWTFEGTLPYPSKLFFLVRDPKQARTYNW